MYDWPQLSQRKLTSQNKRGHCVIFVLDKQLYELSRSTADVHVSP